MSKNKVNDEVALHSKEISRRGFLKAAAAFGAAFKKIYRKMAEELSATEKIST